MVGAKPPPLPKGCRNSAVEAQGAPWRIEGVGGVNSHPHEEDGRPGARTPLGGQEQPTLPSGKVGKPVGEEGGVSTRRTTLHHQPLPPPLWVVGLQPVHPAVKGAKGHQGKSLPNHPLLRRRSEPVETAVRPHYLPKEGRSFRRPSLPHAAETGGGRALEKSGADPQPHPYKSHTSKRPVEVATTRKPETSFSELTFDRQFRQLIAER